MNPQYLGDGVYIQVDKEENTLMLTTGNHIFNFCENDSKIYLEDATMLALLKYIKANRPDLLTSL